MDSQALAIPLASALNKPASGVLTRAFYNDPFFTFVLPQTAERDLIMPWLFERLVRYGQLYGRVFTTPALEGVAMWLGPQKTGMQMLGVLRSGLFQIPFRMPRQEFKRSMAMVECADRMHEKLIQGEHWYLYELGVEPSYQHRGVGRALLQPILSQADLEGLACYLETNNEVNLHFYEQNGFKVMGQEQATPESPYNWAMIRKPG